MGLDARDFEGATESRHGPPFPSQPLQRMMWYDTKIVSYRGEGALHRTFRKYWTRKRNMIPHSYPSDRSWEPIINDVNNIMGFFPSSTLAADRKDKIHATSHTMYADGITPLSHQCGHH